MFSTGSERELVFPSDFKSAATLLTRGWVGSIPIRFRQFGRAAGRSAASRGFASVATVGTLLLVAIAGCSTPPSIDDTKLVDLTHPLGEKTIFWPTAMPFKLQVESAGRSEAGYWYAANRFCTSEHGGTHLDAPYHFAEHGWKADEIPVSRLVGPACVLDVSAQATADPDYLASAGDLKAWEGRHGRLPDGAILLLRTGWGKRWGDRRAYLGDDTPGDASHLHFPGIGRDLAELLVHERKVDAVGIDTASIDHGPSTDFIVHQTLFAANIPAFENLANLENLPETGATLIALPARIEGGTGGPLRAVAVLP